MKTQILLIIALSLAAFQGLFAQTESDSAQQVQEALALIHTPAPTFKPAPPMPPDPKLIADMGFEQPNSFEQLFFEMPDGVKLNASKYPHESQNMVLLLHGVLGSNYTFNKMSGLLREALDAEIFALDFRGHGQSGGRPGDVDYIDQYAHDVKEVISQLKASYPERRLILAGHSMGGGISLRFQMLEDHPEVDAFLLFAPHLGHNAPPLLNQKPKASDAESEPFLQLHLQRLMGLSLLNSYGIHAYDSLEVLYFNLPETMPLRTYTHRSNLSSAPQDYQAALQAVDKPLLVVVGSEDEAFAADQYDAAVSQHSEGEVVLVAGASHNGIRHAPEAMAAVKQWAQRIGINQ